MPIYYGNTATGNTYVDAYPLGNVYYGDSKIQGNFTTASISQTNLIFNVDANNTASYPGSGSIWYNTATNGASTNLLFTGSVDYVVGGTNITNYLQFNTASYWSTSNISETVNSRTLCAWVWIDNTISNEWINYGRGTGFVDTGNTKLNTEDNVGKFFTSNFAPILSGSVTTGQWYNLIGVGYKNPNVGEPDQGLFYINGRLVKFENSVTLDPRTNRAVWSSNLFGRISMMSIYKVALDAAGAATYFNNTKELFGY
jgi:hypothetical protein